MKSERSEEARKEGRKRELGSRKRGGQEEVPDSLQDPGGWGQPTSLINKGGLKHLTGDLARSHCKVGTVQEGWWRHNRINRIKEKRTETERGESKDRLSLQTHRIQELRSTSGQHLSLGGNFRLGPQLGLGLNQRARDRHGEWLGRQCPSSCGCGPGGSGRAGRGVGPVRECRR